MTGGDPVNANEIRWELAPDAVPDPLLQSDDDVLFQALSEAQVYRLMAQEAIHLLHACDQELRRLRRQHYALLDQYRALRARVAA